MTKLIKSAKRPAKDGEFDRIARFFEPLARNFPGALGLKDDAALLCHAENEKLVVTTDAMVAGIHFFEKDAPEDIAAKLMAVNLSDLAAMGANAYAYTLITSLPRKIGTDWLAAFTKSLAQLQKKYGIALAGGDSVRTEGPMTLAITAFGIVPVGQEVRRKVGLASIDNELDLLVSGTIGDAALGLGIATKKFQKISQEDKKFLLARFHRPTPRLALVPVLRRYALAAVDISDGLVADTGHIAEASRFAIEIERDKVPLSPATKRLVANDETLMERVLTGGDDYEIACVCHKNCTELMIKSAKTLGVKLTKIGTAKKNNRKISVTVFNKDGSRMSLAHSGWQHF